MIQLKNQISQDFKFSMIIHQSKFLIIHKLNIQKYNLIFLCVTMKLIYANVFKFSTKVGFVGLGNMGFPMAINLAKKGFEVYAYDIDTKKQAETSKHNIKFVPQIKALAKLTNKFVTMLPNSEHSVNVCSSDGGIFKNAPKNSLILDCSTISPLVAKQLNETGKNHHIVYVDAPVSGGVGGAQAGTLTFMLGSQNQEIFNQAKAILEAMGKSIFNCEKPGAGQIAKICNNMALAIQMIGVSEALALGKKLGIDDKILSNIMKVSSSRCWSVDTYNPVPGVMQNVPASRDYERGFGCELMLKDLKIAQDCANEIKSPIVLGKKSKQIYQKLTNEGNARKDFGIIFQKIYKGSQQ